MQQLSGYVEGLYAGFVRAAAAAADFGAGGSLHRIDLAALQSAVGGNLARRESDPWLADVVEEANSGG
jgi:hypothetical protein